MTTFDAIEQYIFFTNDECDEIKEYAYRKEDELIKEGYKDTITNKTNSITTNNYFRYNFFRDHPVYCERFVDFLRKTNQQLEWPILVQSWVNIYRKDDGLGWHNHLGGGRVSYNCLAANIFIDGPTKPGTTYLNIGQGLEELNRENKKGCIQIFPASIYHKVEPVSSDRISIGITIHSFESIDKDNIDLLALNSRKVSNSIVLSKRHYEDDVQEIQI